MLSGEDETSHLVVCKSLTLALGHRPKSAHILVRACLILHKSDFACKIAGFFGLLFFAKKNSFIIHSILAVQNIN
jgi:hypothetical protein